MRIDAAVKLTSILSKSLDGWSFDVVATDKGNAFIAVTSEDLQSSFRIDDLPPHEGRRGFQEEEDIAARIAADNPNFRASGVNVYGLTERGTFDATVQVERVSIHVYCDAEIAERIAQMIKGTP